ncbi:MAG TPA: M17 family peptidase N-terminal domain-containing protein, partial [Candidatus Polarisedimenticolaceae bacterium]|nr:M17 family peptidase N-terminal domain-containing protein [Candidatus Polarisedimenticolaceae bacterium]
MRIRVTRRDLSALEADLAVCFAHENDREPRGVEDERLRRELATQMQTEEFRGRPGDKLAWNTNGRYGSRRFLVIGLGAERPAPGEAIRAGCARAARLAAGFSART